MKRLIPLVLLTCIGVCVAGPGRIEPERPQWGSTLVVTYDPASEGAKFSTKDKVQFVAWLHFPDGTRKAWGNMTLEDGLFRHEILVARNLGHVRIFFLTPSDWDQAAEVSSMVYSEDGVPARGAYQHDVDPDTGMERVKEELALYPDNYWAYHDKWNNARLSGDEEFPAMVKKDLAAFETHAEEGRPVDLLFARVTGLLFLDREGEARKALRELAEVYPASEFLRLAIHFYDYLTFVNGWKGEGPEEVADLTRTMALAHPSGPLAREEFHFLAYDESVPLEGLESVFDAWVAEEPDHPFPYLGLATAYHRRGVKPSRAETLIESAIDLLLQGQLRPYEDIGGKETVSYTTMAFRLAAEIALEQGRYADSLAYARAAQTLKEQSDGKPYLVESRLWTTLSFPRRAETALLDAWREDPESAEPELRNLYSSRHGSLEGFEEWLRDTTRKLEEAGDDRVRVAPPFRVTTLSGETMDRAGLDGKVVVLNFWFTACAPCVVEMPSLNGLVQEFAEQPVVFLAPAIDDEENLRSFLKDHEFLYRVVPDAGELHGEFEVSAYPTHMIVDREGRIRHVLSGGDRDTDDRLRPLIRQLVE